MDKLTDVLLQHGPFALVALIFGIALKIMWTRYVSLFEGFTQFMLKDAEAKSKLADALEDMVESMEAYGKVSSKMNECKLTSGKSLEKIESLLEDQRLYWAKEEGRREVTAKIVLPKGDPE
jgi:ERCC4-type nuclease